ncbi:unnamed protein product [Symbiodinium natans]|uniref:Uncharacterized protein n=1 Tax=Symbiodinium natans TaxID=878477 RepID=A0A812IET4_9DINO|nr:unnamed protein product [Symbiodinium natans]
MHRALQLGVYSGFRRLPSSRWSLRFGGRRELQQLVFPAADFRHILDDAGKVCDLYAGHPLSGLSPHKRGLLLQNLCKTVLASAHPHLQLEEPVSGRCVNGQRRTAQQALWDWTLGGRKAECKSCRLGWMASNHVWAINVSAVKLPLPGVRTLVPFDDLYLVVDTPDVIHILKHDLRTGVSTAGSETAVRGQKICVSGGRGAAHWRDARTAILRKLCAGRGQCEMIAEIPVSDIPESDQSLQAALSQEEKDKMYQGIPLSRMTPSLRALRIEQIGCEIDRKLNPRCSIFRQAGGDPQVDWLRDDVRVELKHTKAVQMKSGSWRVCFSKIKCAVDGLRETKAFDELWLAVYSPLGIDFFKSNGDLPYTSVGVREAFGNDLDIRSHAHETELRAALCSIRWQLERMGCCLTASVRW